MSITQPDDRVTSYAPVVPTTTFAADFPVFDNDDIAVFVNGVEREDFTVSATYVQSISNDARVIFNPGITGNVLVVGARQPRRTSRFGAGPINANLLNAALDPLVGEMQEARRDLSRAILAPFGSSIPNTDEIIEAGAAAVAAANSINQRIYTSVALAIADTIPAIVKRIQTQFLSPSFLVPATLVGGAHYRRISFTDLNGYPSQSYFRTSDRFMPDGSTSAANGGYWVLDESVALLTQFGGIPDFNGVSGTSCTTAWDSLVQFCLRTGAQGFIDPGSFYLATTPAPNGGGNLNLTGIQGRSRLYFAGSGIAINIVQSDPFSKTILKNFMMIAWREAGPSALALNIEYPEVPAITGVQVDIDIEVHSDSGSVSAPWRHTWESGMSFKNVWNRRLKGVVVLKPDLSPSGSFIGRHDGSFIVRLQGGAYGSIAGATDRFTGLYANHGFLCDAYTEGERLTDVEFIGVTKGITVPVTTPPGGAVGVMRGESFWLSNIHIACFEAGLDMNTVQHVYGGANIQRSSGGAANWAAVVLQDCTNCTDLRVTAQGNNGTGTATGLISNGGGGHDIILITENVSVDFAFTSPKSKLTGKNSNDSTGASREASTFSSSTSTLIWQTVDGSLETNGLQISKNVGGQSGIFAYNPALASAQLALAAKGAGNVTLRNDLGQRVLFSADQGEALPSQWLRAVAYATGNGAELTVGGAAANINLRIQPKGSGGRLLMEWLASSAYANDAAAAGGGIPIGAVYINSTTGALTLRRT